MRLRVLILSTVVISALGALPSATAADTAGNQPVLTFVGHVVTVGNLQSPSGAVLFAVGLVPDGYQSTVVRWASILPDTAHTGSVQFDTGSSIPCKSIWVAADLTSGQYAIAAPPGCPLRMASLAAHSFKRNAQGDIDSFVHPGPFLDFLYVHPGKGAWIIRAKDGYEGISTGTDDDTESDTDGKSDGVTTVAFGTARNLVAGSSENMKLVPGGLLFAIDLYRLDIVVVRVDQQMLNEVGP
jgi:hypothetical protein